MNFMILCNKSTEIYCRNWLNLPPPPMSNCHKDHVTLQLLLNSSWSAAASHQNREFVRKIYDGWCVTWEQVLGRVGAAREWDRATASAG